MASHSTSQKLEKHSPVSTLKNEGEKESKENATSSTSISEKADDRRSSEEPTNIVDGGDDEFRPRKYQLISCNQQPESLQNRLDRPGYFLQMQIDDQEESGFRITTTASQNDPHAMWKLFYTGTQDRRQVLVFENEQCSRETERTCVLSTQKIQNDFILVGKKIDSMPRNLSQVDQSVGFYREPRAVGSELLYFKSMLQSKEQGLQEGLLLGFDAEGQPLPLNKVQKNSKDSQAYFRLIPGEYS